MPRAYDQIVAILDRLKAVRDNLNTLDANLRQVASRVSNFHTILLMLFKHRPWSMSMMSRLSNPEWNKRNVISKNFKIVWKNLLRG